MRYWQISKKGQDADPVIKRMKELMREFGDIAPNKVQLNSELAEVKSFCLHWNLLEIINDVATRFGRSEDLCMPCASFNVHLALQRSSWP